MNISSADQTKLNRAILNSPVSKGLNRIEYDEAIYRILDTPALSLKSCNLTGTIPELSFDFALNSTTIIQQALVDEVRTSFLCRSRDAGRAAYGDCFNFRDSFSVFDEVTVSGRVVGNGGKVFFIQITFR